MNNVTPTIAPTPTALSLKGVNSNVRPEIKVVDESDFSKYVFSGITVKINTPVIKNSRNALFTINLDGFIPWMADNTPLSLNSVWRNMFPVNPTPQGLGNVSVFYEAVTLPPLRSYYSTRFKQGNIGVGMRISSNTVQTGNLFISQGSGLVRQWRTSSEDYIGAEFLNATTNVSDFAPGNFQLVDLSLNRMFSVTGLRHDPNNSFDLYQKMLKVYETSNPLNESRYNQKWFAQNQFLEDHLFVGILSDLPEVVSNQITITLFFDYSNVFNFVPWLPMYMMPNRLVDRQILDVTATLTGSTSWDWNSATWINPVPPEAEEESFNLKDLAIKDKN